jgi:hypothetical protein
MVALAFVLVTASGAAARVTAVRTKKTAELNVLAYVLRSAGKERLPGLVTPGRTAGRQHGGRLPWPRAMVSRQTLRALHVRRPTAPAHAGQGLFLRYLALPHGRFAVRRMRFVGR